MRWAGIDEAGYGPNLGPLVMVAVVAEGPDDRPPDLWADLAGTVARAGSRDGRLWVDDSKRVLQARDGLERLEAGTLAALEATGGGVPSSLFGLLRTLGAGDGPEGEAPCGLAPWFDGDDPGVPRPGSSDLARRWLGRDPLRGASWRLVAVRAAVVEPGAFNRRLAATGSKARVHFDAFAGLLRGLWGDLGDSGAARVVGDKHGGRHFYHELLLEAFPDAWIDRGPEGPAESRYAIRAAGRRLDLALRPRADAGDGLVALASMVAKAVRERWMGLFNAHWTARLPGLRPTAGYPADAARFRAAIEPSCLQRGLPPASWWREK